MELREVTWGTWGHTAGEWQCQCSNPGLSDSMPTPGVGRGIKRCHREDGTSAWQTFDNRLYLNPFRTSLAQTSKGCYSLKLGSRDAREENRRKQLLLREKSASIQTSKHRLSASVAGLELVLPWCSALKKELMRMGRGRRTAHVWSCQPRLHLKCSGLTKRALWGRITHIHRRAGTDAGKDRLHSAGGTGARVGTAVELCSPKSQDRCKHGVIKRERGGGAIHCCLHLTKHLL